MTADPLWTSDEVGQATQGALVGGEWTAQNVAIDSRELVKGDLFLRSKDCREMAMNLPIRQKKLRPPLL